MLHELLLQWRLLTGASLLRGLRVALHLCHVAVFVLHVIVFHHSNVAGDVRRDSGDVFVEVAQILVLVAALVQNRVGIRRRLHGRNVELTVLALSHVELLLWHIRLVLGGERRRFLLQ